MIDSALGLDPDDNSEDAKAKRRLRGLADLDGITFVAKITVEPSNDPRYPDQNKLDRPVLPNEKEWRAVMNGEDVAPSPRGRVRQAARRHAARPRSPPGASSLRQPRSRPLRRPGSGPATRQDAGGGQPAKPAGPAWLNQ